MSRIPPLTALRAFTATARHLSFIGAAEELHVTPAAIGQHVRLLETHFGQPLFLRNRGQLELTSEGRTLFPGLQQAFEMVLSAVSSIGANDETPELRISAPPSFLSKWLIPRLAEIRDEVPDARIVLQRDDAVFVNDADRPNCAIRLAGADVPGADADYLFQEEMVAICTPSYRLRYDLSPGDLGLDRITLLGEARHESDSLYPGWNRWFKLNDVKQSRAARQITFADPSMVIDAALGGHGVGLASLALVQNELAAGRLVVPYGNSMPMRQAYFFLCLDPSATSSPVDAFRRWLLQQAANARVRPPAQTGLRDRILSIAAE
ncbi:LysR substrate-binding domain-containing protein [Agrobacterium vitis]|uniref:LysR substrate-binding domain-containing protein n=1 Tax=Agrobacterium vitis TaxID=373 RepID=UPI000AFA7BD4|nr:LysR substrate-binding domain-containing protein [Agrobacterium vitis]